MADVLVVDANETTIPSSPDPVVGVGSGGTSTFPITVEDSDPAGYMVGSACGLAFTSVSSRPISSFTYRVQSETAGMLPSAIVYDPGDWSYIESPDLAVDSFTVLDSPVSTTVSLAGGPPTFMQIISPDSPTDGTYDILVTIGFPERASADTVVMLYYRAAAEGEQLILNAGFNDDSLDEEPEPPTAIIEATQLTTNPNVPITFYGTESYDLDGTVEGYAWSIEQADEDGPTDPLTGTDDTITASFSQVGTYEVSLTVTDDDDLTDTATTTVTVVLPEVTTATAGQPVLIRKT